MTILTIVPVAGRAQCEGADGQSWEFDEANSKGFSVGRLLGSLLTPQLIQDTRAIREYVRDPRFGELLQRCGDLRAVDAVYQKALRIAEYNIGRALFLSMVASLEHRNIGVELPVVGTVGLPLTFEEDSLFQQRIMNLPSKLYHDSPGDVHGDKDKLQHFFGSAYLAFTSESREFTRSAGNFVEWGEAQMIVGGVNDVRDKRANKQGETFGHDLLYVKTLLPSDYLTLPVKDE
ncbi:MAG: hypothetical protein HYW57_06175 [Ignavibacteriales bacterium]|nr:hypothetical protein [Ignavibacteriales bacterium]